MTDRATTLPRRFTPQAEAMLDRLGTEIGHCLRIAHELQPGDDDYHHWREAEIRHAAKLGKTAAKLMFGLAKLTGRSEHHIRVTHAPAVQGENAAERLIRFLDESPVTRDLDMPQEERARISVALQEEEFHVTDEEMHTVDTRPLRNRLARFRRDRTERRRLLLHESDRARLTQVELEDMNRQQFAERLQTYALQRSLQNAVPEDAAEGEHPEICEVRMPDGADHD